MPRAKGSKDYTSLVSGLVTEASPLAFPEGSTSDELNFLLDLDGGVRRRRRGYTKLSSDFSVTGSGSLVTSGYWREATLLYVVLALGTGTFIRFHRTGPSYNFVSEYELSSEALSSVFVSEARGDLIITGGSGSGGGQPVLISKQDESTANVYTVTLYIRDFKLLEDGYRVSERPAEGEPSINGFDLDPNTDEHQYNLLNAGWYEHRKVESGAVVDPIQNFASVQGAYPSNADVVSLGVKVNDDGDLVFSAESLIETVTGNSEAARGHYVYDITNVDRQARVDDKTEDGTVDSTLTLQTTINI